MTSYKPSKAGMEQGSSCRTELRHDPSCLGEDAFRESILMLFPERGWLEAACPTLQWQLDQGQVGRVSKTCLG